MADHALENSVGAIGWFIRAYFLTEDNPNKPTGNLCQSFQFNCFSLLRQMMLAWWPLEAPCWCEDSYLVDSASSHMLVSKIKPCMSKYKQFIPRNCEWLIKSVIVYLIVPLLG